MIEQVGTLLNWFLYVGLALSVAVLIISILLAAFGRWSSKLFFSALAGILVSSSANAILNALTEGVFLEDPFTLIPMVIVAALLVGSVIYYGMGRAEDGNRYFIAAALAAGFFAAVPAIQGLFGSGVVVQPVGACVLEVMDVKYDKFTANVDVKMTYGKGSYTLTVNWGDGTTSSGTISAGQTVTMSHTYSSGGTYGVAIEARGEGYCIATAGLNVNPSPLPWWAGILDIGGAIGSLGAFVNVPFHLFYTTPELDLSSESEDMKIYSAVAAIAAAFLGIFIALRIAGGFVEKDPAEGLVESMKDAVIVVVLILLAPHLYQIVASMCNATSMYVVRNWGITIEGIASIVGLIAFSVVAGVVTSFFGSLGANLAMALMFSSFVAMLRFSLIKALIYCAPILLVAFLFPLTRGAVKFFGSLLAGLVLSGPVAAFVLVAMSTLPGVGGFIKFFAPAIAMAAFPFIFMSASGSLMPAASNLFRMGSASIAGIPGKISATSRQAPQGHSIVTGGSNPSAPGSIAQSGKPPSPPGGSSPAQANSPQMSSGATFVSLGGSPLQVDSNASGAQQSSRATASLSSSPPQSESATTGAKFVSGEEILKMEAEISKRQEVPTNLNESPSEASEDFAAGEIEQSIARSPRGSGNEAQLQSGAAQLQGATSEQTTTDTQHKLFANRIRERISETLRGGHESVSDRFKAGLRALKEDAGTMFHYAYTATTGTQHPRAVVKSIAEKKAKEAYYAEKAAFTREMREKLNEEG